jgi:type I restriction enzyme S subunit
MGRAKEISKTKEAITETAINDCKMRLVQPGTVLFSFKLSIGKLGIAAVPLFTNEAIASLPILDRECLCGEYLFHALQEVSGRLVGDRAAMGITLNKASLAQIEIPLPPLEEQRRIAAILDKAAEISDANKRRQNLLKAFPLSVYRQMLGDPRQNPFQWPVFSLGEICLNEDARRVPVKSSDRKAMQGRFPYYGASGIIDHVDSYLFDGPRLLVGEDGANLLARSSPIAFIADGKYWVNNHAHVLGENGKAKLRFLEYYFALVDLKPFVTGSAQPKLTRSALDLLPVPLPPLDLQERFESVLTAMNITLAQVKTSNEQALSLINALRHMSFQGESA